KVMLAERPPRLVAEEIRFRRRPILGGGADAGDIERVLPVRARVDDRERRVCALAVRVTARREVAERRLASDRIGGRSRALRDGCMRQKGAQAEHRGTHQRHWAPQSFANRAHDTRRSRGCRTRSHRPRAARPARSLYNPRMTTNLTLRDALIAAVDEGLRTLTAVQPPSRPNPARAAEEARLTRDEKRVSRALMRVNHAGEIAAQALYTGQAIGARAAATREHLLTAAREERDHLVWCRERLDELGGRPSVLGPFWYVGSLCIGLVAGSFGDATSLGFVAETERQVEAHLEDHLGRLPAADEKSR